MRFLFLNPVGSIGGAEQALLTAAGGIRTAEPAAEVHLIAGTDGPLIGRAAALGVRTSVLPMPLGMRRLGDSGVTAGKVGRLTGLVTAAARSVPAAWDYARRLRVAVQKARPDVVHSNGIKCHLLTRVAVPRGVPVVWWVQDFFGQRAAAGKLLRLASARCHTALAISNAVAADVRAVLPRVPVRVVYHAVDTTRFSPGPGSGAELDRLAGLPPAPAGTVRVGLVAAYARWKGHLVVLDAAARLAAAQPNLPVRWYIVGGPIYHTANQFSPEELRSVSAAHGLGDRLGFVGFQSDTAHVYRSLDIVLHASTLPEPFGLVIAEAMACGRAVVVSAAGGAAELFTEGHDALGVAPGDANGLAGAVRRLAGDANLRARLGASARATVCERFDAARIGPQLLTLYRELGAGP
jgi:glycosyltransferase involved in cell wall biosynthesis